jgi:hypothetical protein
VLRGTVYTVRRYVTRQEFDRAISQLNERIATMATQADVDAITTQVDQVATDLANAKTALQQEIDQLASANPQLNLTALQSAVQPLDGAVQALDALKPDSPPPAATPPAGP